jgi:hypothetical protein
MLSEKNSDGSFRTHKLRFDWIHHLLEAERPVGGQALVTVLAISFHDT